MSNYIPNVQVTMTNNWQTRCRSKQTIRQGSIGFTYVSDTLARLKYFDPMLPVPRHITIWPHRNSYSFNNSIQKSLQRRGRLKDAPEV
jgi:hypothetical protein